MVRLFANIMAGHMMVLGLVSVIFVTVKLGPVINGSMTVIAMLFGLVINALELLVAFIQAYIFTLLSAVYVQLAEAEGH
jgi:F-type H+-transporting ATPase subunit a